MQKGDKMIIGIDIDDVLTDTSSKMKEYLYNYEKSGDGIKYMVEVMRGEVVTKNIEIFFKEYANEVLKNVEVKQDAIDVIKRLRKDGHKIIFITSRGEDRFPGSVQTTYQFLEKHDLQYDGLVFNSHEKQIDCQKYQVELMIDDSVKNCEAVQKAGIPAIVYTSEINKDIQTDIERVDNWITLEKRILS